MPPYYLNLLLGLLDAHDIASCLRAAVPICRLWPPLSSINPDPVDLTELVIGLGKDALEFESSIADHIDF